MTPRLELKNLAKSFGDNQAVRDMNLSLAPGEFVSLLGPSGCGKSTTLAMIAGFEPPTSGDILVDGQSIREVEPGRRAIGLVFQDYAVFSRLTVLDNLKFGLEAQNVPRRERQERIGPIAEKLDLTRLFKRRGATLNMSEMQRVALGRVLVTKPSLLLLDEPMSNLDAALRASLRSELKVLQLELEQTILYVTHDQVEAMAMSDRIAVMNNGVIEQIGSPDTIYNRPETRFTAEFIGDPPINLVPCTIRSSGSGQIVETAGHRTIDLPGTPRPNGTCLAGIRAHDFYLADAGDGNAQESRVRFVENHGVEHIAHCEYGNELVAVAIEPGEASAGETVRLGVRPGTIRFFDADNGTAIGKVDADVLA